MNNLLKFYIYQGVRIPTPVGLIANGSGKSASGKYSLAFNVVGRRYPFGRQLDGGFGHLLSPSDHPPVNCPPFTSITWPVTNPDSEGEARNSATPTQSSA